MGLNTRAGRVISAANEDKLKKALEAITEVLAQLGGDESNSLGAAVNLAIRSAVGIESRSFDMADIEIREEDGKPLIRGHAAVFDTLSVFLYGFREKIAPGAFADSLEGGDIRALWQHDTSRVLGRTKSGTLKLWEDDHGLAFELEPPDTADGRDAVTLIRRGDVSQMSFGFTTAIEGGDTWEEDDSGMPIRTLRKVNLLEISPVTWPAYPDTGVSVVRSAPEWVQRALRQGDEETDGRARARLDWKFKLLRLV